MQTNPLNASSINSDDEDNVEMTDKRSQNDILENNITIFPDFWIKLAGLELKPEGLWKIPWYFWRIVIVGNVIVYSYFFVTFDPIYKMMQVCPILSYIAILVAFSALPKIMYDLRTYDNIRNIKASKNLSFLYFSTLSLFLLVLIVIFVTMDVIDGGCYDSWLDDDGDDDDIIILGIEIQVIIFLGHLSIVVGLTFVIFCISLDTRDCENKITKSKLSAKQRSITLYEYSTLRKEIHEKAEKWKQSNYAVVSVAVLNLIIYIYYTLYALTTSSDTSALLRTELLYIVTFGKEVVLLLIIIMLVARVNNCADTITSVLLIDRYEDCSATQQRERQEILNDIALTAPHITGNTSMWDYLMMPSCGGVISFKLLNVRVNATWLATTAITSLITFIVAIIRIII
jgi:hypothetical protein